MTFAEQVALREKYEAAKKTMLVFVWNNFIMALDCERVPESCLKEMPDGSCRIYFTAKQIAIWRNRASALIGRADTLTAEYEKLTGRKVTANKGYFFEWCGFKRFHKETEWQPNSVPFWEAPDLTTEFSSYQIKGQRATYFTPENIERLKAL